MPYAAVRHIGALKESQPSLKRPASKILANLGSPLWSIPTRTHPTWVKFIQGDASPERAMGAFVLLGAYLSSTRWP